MSLILCIVLASITPRGGSYTAGNLLILQVQQNGCAPSATCPSAANSAAFTITELATTGSIATAPVAIPSTTCQMSSQRSDGRLTLSEDGSSVSFACYNAGGSTPNVGTSSVGRVVGSISATGAQSFVTNLQPGGMYSNAPFSSAVRLPSGSYYGAGAQTPCASLITSGGSVTSLASTGLLRAAIYAGTLYATQSAGGSCQLLQIGSAGTLPLIAGAAVTPLGELGPGTANAQGVAANAACGTKDYAMGWVFQSASTLWSCVWGGGAHLGLYSLTISGGTVQTSNYVWAQKLQSCLDITGQYEGPQWVLYYVSIDSSSASFVMRMPAVVGYAAAAIAQSTGLLVSYQGIALVPLAAGSTVAASASSSAAPIPSRSQTATPSRTQQSTPSPTPTKSPASSPSPTATKTPSSTRTSTRTASITASMTGSGTSTPSQYNSGTHSLTPSQVASPSGSASRSQSASLTASESLTSSPSSTGSTTVTPSMSLSPSQAVSPTASYSRSTSPSSSGTRSASAMSTPSQAQTPAPSALPIASSPITSASPSARPFVLLLRPDVDRPLPYTVSDALAPLSVSVALDRCSGDSLRLRCGVTPDSSNASEALGLSQVPDPSVGLAPGCETDRAAPAQLPVALRVGANFRTGGGDATLSCEAYVVASGRSIAAGALALQVKPTRWPTFSLAFVVSREGLMRATVGGPAVNVTATLLDVGCASAPNCTVEKASQEPATALLVAQALAGAAPSTPVSAPPFAVTLTGSAAIVLASDQSAFDGFVSVTVGGVACDAIVVSADGRWLAFRTPPTEALCPGQTSQQDCGYRRLLLSNPSDGGTRLGGAIECPPMCPGVTGEYAELPAVDVCSAARLRMSRDPRDAGISLVPFATGSQNLTAPMWVAALPAVSGGLATPAVLSSVTSLGIYYAFACASTGLYTDPATGACTNASDPASALCAFGSGDSCQRCPSGGLCPGGSRCWSRPGYYAVSESSAMLTACPPPQSTVRCAGWGAGVAATVCGPGYLQGSYLCSACAPSFYAVGDGTCAACPVITGAWERYKGLMQLIGGVIAFAVAVYGCLLLIVRVAGGTVVGGAGRLAALVVWAITTAQVVSQVARVSSPSLPPLMTALYRAVAVLQLEGIVLPPECTGAYPFETEVAVMVVALVLEVAAAAALVSRRYLKAPWASGKAAGFAGRVALTGAVVLYPTVVNGVSGLLNCNTVTISTRALATLDGGASISSTSAVNGGVSVTLLSNNPFIVCWAGRHAAAGRLAAASVPLFVFLLPIGVFVALITDPMLRWHLARRALRRREKSALQPALIAPPDTASSFVRSNPLAVALSRGQALRPGGGISAPSASDIDAAAVLAPAAPPGDDPTLAPFLSEYLYAAWWFKHVDLGTLAGTAVQVRISKPLSKGVLPRPATVPQVTAKATLSCIALAVLLAVVVLRRPFSETDAWKGPVKVALVLLSMSCVALNASATTVDIMEGAGQSAASLIQSVSVGSYLLFVACVATAVVLVGSFARTLVVAAREEQEGMAARRDPREKRVQRLKGTLAPLSMGAPLSTHPRLDVHAPPGALRLTAAHLDRARSDSSRVAALFQQPGSPPLASARVGWGATPTAAFRGGRRLSTRAGVASSVRQMHAALSAESGHSREPRPSETVAGASGLQY